MHQSLQPKGTIWFAIVLMLIAFAGAVFWFSKDSPAFTSEGWTNSQATVHQPRHYTITYESHVFSPTNLRVRVNDIVEIKNASAGILKLGGIEKTIPAGQTVEVVFDREGQVSYYNSEQQSEQGTILIKPN